MKVAQVIQAPRMSEGAGATVYRSIGTQQLRNLDPFLMLDEFHVRKPAGFPAHPHRGFETITYMHKDFVGHSGVIQPGGVQWMTAGRGIVHSEMPHSDGLNRGLQLWLNLKKDDKMVEPAYQELSANDIPKAVSDDGKVKASIIAGTCMGVESPVYTRTKAMYLDLTMDANAVFSQRIPALFDQAAFVYVLEGEAAFGSEQQAGKAHEMLLLGSGTELHVATSSNACRYVVIAGEPVREPVFQHGPFVMSTQEEIMQTFMDYQTKSNGFEPLQNPDVDGMLD